MSLTFPEYESFDGLGLANIIKSGVISPNEVLEAAIERIEFFNPRLNAVIHKMYDQARVSLKNNPSNGLFYGVPTLLKDLLAEYEGAPMSFGSAYAYQNKWVSKFDSELVKRLKKSGMVILGKTNVPEFGLSPVTEPDLFGPTRNPWDLERSSGGSSGGAAAAVAARMVPIAHGGDGGGSLRIPASYSGVLGFKPSRGRTPTGPVFMRVWLGMVVEHALSRSVRDSAAMLDVLAGYEIGSPISLPKPKCSFLEQLEQPLPKLRIALIDHPFFSATLDPEYAAALKKAAKLCEQLGHHVEPVSFEVDRDVAFAVLNIMIAENSAGLKGLIQQIGTKPKAHQLESVTAWLCHVGDKLSASSYSWAVYTLDQAGRQLAEFLENFDVILTPTMPFPAPKVGEFKSHLKEEILLKILRYVPFGPKLQKYIQQASEKNFSYMAFTGLYNIGGQPAMSVPLYWDKNGMPIGIQFAAKINQDSMLLQLAKQLEEAHPWEQKRPPHCMQVQTQA